MVINVLFNLFSSGIGIQKSDSWIDVHCEQEYHIAVTLNRINQTNVRYPTSGHFSTSLFQIQHRGPDSLRV